MIYFIDYSKGFGGKYGVQKDRVDQVNNNFIIDSIVKLKGFYWDKIQDTMYQCD